MNVPNWFPVWFSSSRVPITSTPTFRRWAVAPGNHENSSASSRLPVLVCWGSPLLPPNASATRVSPPVGRAEPTSTYPDGSLRNAVASRRWRATYPRSSLMKCPPKNEVSEAMTPPPRVVRVPPVAGRARLPTRVGSWDSQLPSSRRVRVWTSLACQSSRSRPSVLFVARSPERPETVTGAPVALARVTKRAAESGLTPSHTSVPGSALTSEGKSWPRQRPCSAANTNSLLGTMGPPMPPPSWFCVMPWPNGDEVTSPHSSERSRSA